MENNNDFNQSTGLRQFFGSIYKRMAFGVFVTALVVFLVAYTEPGQQLFALILGNPIFYYGLIAIELVLLFGVQWGINRISEAQANILFYIYAAINGITLSAILFLYTGASIISVFVGALAMFAALAYVGQTTKKDLSGWGTFLYAGMWGVFVTSIINIFLQSSGIDWIVTIVGVLVFAGLTVYDNQAYKKIYLSNSDKDLGKEIAIGALHMYINFIMIFTNLLKIVGRD